MAVAKANVGIGGGRADGRGFRIEGAELEGFRSDTLKSVIMEYLSACDNRDAGSINFCFTPYAATHTFA